MDFLGLLRPVLGLFGIPLLISFPVTIGLWFATGKPVPEFLLLPIALLLTPSLWLGIVLAVLLSRYFTAARKASAGNGSLKSCAKALKRLDRAYRCRELLARGPIRNAVYIGYFLKYVHLSAKLTGHPLNAYRGGSEEQIEDRRRRGQALFCKLCEFVYVTGTSGPEKSKQLFQELVELIPEGPSRPLFTTVLTTTFGDGAGFLSTLTAATYVHYAVELPVAVRTTLDRVLARAIFDPVAFGWLSNRVVEASIYLCVAGDRSSDAVLELVQPVLDEITAGLSTCTDKDELLRVKWEGRGLLRRTAEIKSRT